MFDKQWDGRNEGKGKGDGSPLGCPLCGEPDGGDHWARQCGEQPLTKIRSKEEREIRAAAERIKRRRGTYAPSEVLKRIVDWVRDNLTSKDPGSFRLWCGLWPGAALDRWDQDISALTGGEPRRLGGLVKRMAAITTRAVSDLWETRKDLAAGRRGAGDRVRPDRAGSRRRRRRGERREPAGDRLVVPGQQDIRRYFGRIELRADPVDPGEDGPGQDLPGEVGPGLDLTGEVGPDLDLTGEVGPEDLLSLIHI